MTPPGRAADGALASGREGAVSAHTEILLGRGAKPGPEGGTEQPPREAGQTAPGLPDP